jgi:ABC-2 type transport system permease protein
MSDVVVSPPPPPPPLAAQRGTIHDLGYGTYSGPRSGPWTRTWIIAREVFRTGWKNPWLRRCMWLSFMVVAVWGVIIFLQNQNQGVKQLEMAKLFLPRVDTYVMWAVTRSLVFIGVLAGAIVGAGSVSDDLRAGAFQFYFARPLRPQQYVLGKLMGVIMTVGLVVLMPAVALALVRVVMESRVEVMMRALPVIPRTAALAGVVTLAISALAVLMSSLTPRRIYAQASFTLLVFVTFAISLPLALALKNVNVRLLSLRDAVEGFGYGLFTRWGFDHTWAPPWKASLFVLLGVFAGASLALFVRIRRVELSSLGT